MLKASDQKKACGNDNLPVKLLVDSAHCPIHIKPSFLYFQFIVAARSIFRPTKGSKS